MRAGVDGGSKQHKVSIVRPDGTVLAQASGTGGTNASLPGSPPAEVARRLDATFASLGVPSASISRCVIGSAGMDGEADVRAIVEAIRGSTFLHPLLARGLAIGIDSATAPAGVLVISDVDLLAPERDVAVQLGVISGTGSQAIGVVRSNGQTRARVVAGGVDAILSDEGSAIAIGTAAARRAVAHADGRRPSALGAAVLRHLGVSPQAWKEIRPIWHAMTKDRQAALTVDVVVPLSAAGDPDAIDLLDQAGVDLAEMVSACARGVAMAPGQRAVVRVTGSVIVRSDRVYQSFCRRLWAAAPALVGTHPVRVQDASVDAARIACWT